MTTKSRSILFSGIMVNAILDGQKTQTRRVIKPQPDCNIDGAYFDAYNSGPQWNWWTHDNKVCNSHHIHKCPYGKLGDELWVRERWAVDKQYNDIKPSNLQKDDCQKIWYAADDIHMVDKSDRGRWRPSIHMPRLVSRITLVIKYIRVERIQDITPLDAKAEGDKERSGMPEFYRRGSLCHVDWFRFLWNSINEKRGFGWETNPFVWVVEFEPTSIKRV